MNLAEIEALEKRVADIDKLMAANAERLGIAAPGSYRHQELRTERAELDRQRYIAATRLEDLIAALAKNYRLFQKRERDKNAPPDPRETALEMLVEDEIDKIERQAARMENQGDHTQARIWRNELIGVRERVARMYGYA